MNKEFFENIVKLSQLGYSKLFQENPFEEDKENEVESQSEEEDYIDNNEEIDFFNHKNGKIIYISSLFFVSGKGEIDQGLFSDLIDLKQDSILLRLKKVKF